MPPKSRLWTGEKHVYQKFPVSMRYSPHDDTLVIFERVFLVPRLGASVSKFLMSPADTGRKPLKLAVVKPACHGQYEEAWHPNWGFLRFSCVDNHQRVLPEKGFELRSVHFHEQIVAARTFPAPLPALPLERWPWGWQCWLISRTPALDSVSSLLSGPLLQTWVHFTWGNGLFCFLSGCKNSQVWGVLTR